MSEHDRNYYVLRAMQEAAAAERATSAEARHVHQQLSELYSAKLGPQPAALAAGPAVRMSIISPKG